MTQPEMIEREISTRMIKLAIILILQRTNRSGVKTQIFFVENQILFAMFKYLMKQIRILALVMLNIEM